MYLSIHVSIYLSIYLLIYLSIYLSIYLPIYLFIYSQIQQYKLDTWYIPLMNSYTHSSIKTPLTSHKIATNLTPHIRSLPTSHLILSHHLSQPTVPHQTTAGRFTWSNLRMQFRLFWPFMWPKGAYVFVESFIVIIFCVFCVLVIITLSIFVMFFIITIEGIRHFPQQRVKINRMTKVLLV